MNIEDLEELLEIIYDDGRSSDIYCSDCGEKIEDWNIPYFVLGPARVVCWKCAKRSIGYER